MKARINRSDFMKKLLLISFLFIGFLSYSQEDADNKAAAIKEATGLSLKNIGSMSIDQLNIVIEIDPSNAQAYYHVGYYYFYTEKNYEKAISNYTQSIELNPSDLNTYYERGRVYYEIGNFIEAIKDFEIALKNGGGDYYHYRFLGHAYGDIGDRENAVKNYEIANNLEGWRKEEIESNQKSVEN